VRHPLVPSGDERLEKAACGTHPMQCRSWLNAEWKPARPRKELPWI
jgi:hypothetical protein